MNDLKQNNRHPPRWADRLLVWFCNPNLLPEIQGDLHELYHRWVKENGLQKARWRYLFHVISFFRPFAIKKRKNTYSINYLDMFKNYFKIALKNLLNRKFYSTINMLGLSIGTACCLIIFQYVAFEYSFDKFNKNAPHLYRILETTGQNGSPLPTGSATTGWALGQTLAQEVPEVIRFVRLHPEYFNAVVSNPTQPDKAFEEEWVYYADSTFFLMFSYPLVAGNPAQALAPGTIMLSESTAKKYFGDEDPLGKTLDVKGWISSAYRVDGIFRDVPENSHLKFDMLLPMTDLLQKSQFSDPGTGWDWTNFITYVQLNENANLAAVEQKFTDILFRNQEEDWKQTNTTGKIKIQPLAEVHLNNKIGAPKAIIGSYQAVYFFAIIGLITLLIALVNYVNLTTTRALDRAREVGVRKVMGAQRGQLVFQFLAESSLMILLAFALALALSNALLPTINNLAGTNLTNTLWTRPDFWIALSIAFCVISLLAGLYPAFILSSFRPVKVLKGKISTSASGVVLRQSLVVLQFTASIILLVGTTIVYKQLNYMRGMDIGMNLEQILTIPGPRVLAEGANRNTAVETLTNELSRLPAIRQMATSNSVPGKGFAWATSIRKSTADPSTEIVCNGTLIDSAFASLYNIQLAAGKGFSNISASASNQEPRLVIINEEIAKALNYTTMDEAVDQELVIGGAKAQIVGVFKDFNWSSAHEAKQRAFFYYDQGNHLVSLKVSSENLSETIASIGDIYKELFPGNPFQYTFANETFDAQYKNDQHFANLFTAFAGLAMFIACLGLFGLVSFTAQQRTKEIGIRKVLGASESGIVSLLSKDFLKLILIAFALASPIAWYLLNQWLTSFTYHIEVQWWVFAFSGALALGIGLLTVSFQTVKAALANPVDSLQNE